jgi:hypothetical protein
LKPISCRYPGRGNGAGKSALVQQAKEELTELQRFECKQFRSEVAFNRLEEWKRLEDQKRFD